MPLRGADGLGQAVVIVTRTVMGKLMIRTHLRRSHAAAVVIAAAVALTAGGAQVVAADASTTQLIALGDSYASGVGTRSYDEGSGACQRSPYAYPVLDAQRIGAALTFAACSGATTSSVLQNQIGSLSSAATFVTVTVGGNDAQFTHVLTTCAQPWWSSDCDGAIDEAQAFITNTLPGRLDALYSAIRSGAPSAGVVVVGYPRIFNGEDCNAATWFSPREEERLNETADLLDATTSSRAAAHGFSFVDPRASFNGHAVCDNPEWINGLSNPVSESYHPNVSGQTGYADLVDDYLT